MLVIVSLSQAQVGIGTTEPDASAVLELQSTEKGLLPPRMTTTERNSISSPAEGLTIYNTDLRCLDTYNGVRWIACNSICVTDVYNPATGQIWMDRNLGASQVATSSTDEDSYGDLYQWGRAADGHEKRDSDTYDDEIFGDGVANFDNDPSNAWHGQFILRDSGANNWVDPSVPGVDDLWQGVNSTNNPCPTGYRLPTDAEWDAELNSWGSNNYSAGAFASLKLPLAGVRGNIDGSLVIVGTFGAYWSSTVSSFGSRALGFDSSEAFINGDFRAFGLSVRCIKHD